MQWLTTMLSYGSVEQQETVQVIIQQNILPAFVNLELKGFLIQEVVIWALTTIDAFLSC